MQQRHPNIQVKADRIFILDRQFWPSAGMSAALGMALGMVWKDLGPEVERSVAHRLVMHLRRAGGETQPSEVRDLAPRSDRIQQALDYAKRHLANRWAWSSWRNRSTLVPDSSSGSSRRRPVSPQRGRLMQMVYSLLGARNDLLPNGRSWPKADPQSR